MPNQKISADIEINVMDGTEAIPVVHGGDNKFINSVTLAYWVAELVGVKTLAVTTETADETPQGMGTAGYYSGFDALPVPPGTIVGYRCMVMAQSTDGDYLFATMDNAVQSVAAVSPPSLTLLAPDVWTMTASPGAAGWTVTTSLDEGSGQLFLTVVGAPFGATTRWSAQFTYRVLPAFA